MVLLTRVLCGINRRKSNFIDSLRIYVRGGTGGNGIPKFGGLGGKGGDVYVEADPNWTLKQIATSTPTKRFIAKVGENSRTYQIMGKSGEDLIIRVPVGISIISEMGRTLAELNHPGERVLVAQGGMGGCPNTQFSGQKGHSQVVTLDLKLIADVGLVGFPNAGKSTLLKALSRASPKIADYPFTTLKPQLGIMEYEDHRQISIADLPGLIEGAHRNVGLGHSFLKHIIRTKILLFVVDINGFQLGPNYPKRDAFETVMLLNKELELYKDSLTDKPAILVINKMDTDDAESKCREMQSRLEELAETGVQSLSDEIKPDTLFVFDEVLPISAKKAFNIKELKQKIRTFIDIHAESERKGPSSIKELMESEETNERLTKFL